MARKIAKLYEPPVEALALALEFAAAEAGIARIKRVRRDILVRCAERGRAISDKWGLGDNHSDCATGGRVLIMAKKLWALDRYEAALRTRRRKALRSLIALPRAARWSSALGRMVD
jgi:hypothetical protein